MLTAFAYLFRTTLRNRVRRQLARLRTPRYALALALGLLYVAALTFRPGGSTPSGAGGIPGFTGVGATLFLSSTFALALFTAKWWLFGASSGTLAFSPAELQFLFPAPIRRRALVLYRLVSTQAALLFSAIFIGLLFRRGAPTLPSPLRVVGLWILFSTTMMHQMGVTLVRTAAAERGSGLRRNAPAIVVVAAGITTLVVAIVREFPPVRTAGGLFHALPALGPILRGPIPSAVLLPFRWLLAPVYAPDTAHWLAAIGPAVAILALHYVWVLRADATFEEAAVDASARRAARIAARSATSSALAPVPSSASRPLVRLAPTGQPWTAIVWKNTVALTRGLRLTVAARVAVVLVVIVSVLRSTGAFGSDGVPSTANGLVVLGGALSLVAAVYLTLLGPLVVRNDLRQDLAHLSVLRTYPLRGRTVVFAEVVSSATAVTVLQLGLLIVGYLLTVRYQSAEWPVRTRTLELLASFLVLPTINGASFLIQNAMALLLPGWVRLGAVTASAGIELIGQRALAAIASFLALAVVLALPAGAAALVAWLVGVTTVTGAAATLAAGFAVIAVELWLAVEWLGGVYERVDPTAITP